MKTSELIGPALDWATIYAVQGRAYVINVGNIIFPPRINMVASIDGFRSASPSTDWAQGGPIIERECIDLYCDHAGVSWRARKMLGERGPMSYGPTPLIAAMRCYCASKLGDEIEIPSELQPCKPCSRAGTSS